MQHAGCKDSTGGQGLNGWSSAQGWVKVSKDRIKNQSNFHLFFSRVGDLLSNFNPSISFFGSSGVGKLSCGVWHRPVSKSLLTPKTLLERLKVIKKSENLECFDVFHILGTLPPVEVTVFNCTLPDGDCMVEVSMVKTGRDSMDWVKATNN